MIQAAISLELKTPFIFMLRDKDSKKNGFSAQLYIETFKEGLFLVLELGTLFQQDNARIYYAGIVYKQFESRGVYVINQPLCSPDLNPIKHAWKALKQQLYRLYPTLN